MRCGWSIVSYEVAYEGLTAAGADLNGVCCQPRAMAADDLEPGADFLASLYEDWLDWQIQAIADRLRIVRFADPKEDERRVRFLLR